MNELAIVIPAYKTDFLNEVFNCIKYQTCQDFALYVFDDASPHDIRKIYDQYFFEDKQCHYIRFNENMGGKNLAEHWNRCIEFIKEEWIWLFSDDDIMDMNCVKAFHEFKKKEKYDVLRFQLSVIEYDGQLRKHCPNYPSVISSQDFFSKLYSGVIDARMPEFILRTSKLNKCGNFCIFDLAWRSDNATVIKIGYPKGIATIPGPRIYWRSSKSNVSGNLTASIFQRKINASIAFFNWIDDFFSKNGLCYTISYIRLMRVYRTATLQYKDNGSLLSNWRNAALLSKSNNFIGRMCFIFWYFYSSFKN